ncbi:MAG: PD40 domain-containing protein [Caldilineae bacterium]|nr:PD40 domain-containing protein [Caldilineae bacterium]
MNAPAKRSLALLGLIGLALFGAFQDDRAPAAARAEAGLAFTDYAADGSTDLYTIASDGTGRRPLLESDGPSETGPAWSPEGRRLAFSAEAAENDRGLFTLVPDDGTLIEVTDGPVDLDPAWSPGGDWLAFVRHTVLDGVIQSSALGLVRPNGAEPRILTLIEGSARIIRHPSWSPDGQHLVFELRQEAGGGADLYLVEPDSGALGRLLGHPGWDDVDPAWSPDGRRIAFASGAFELASARTRHDIWLYDLNSGQLGSLVTDPAADLRRPAWSPDGSRLAYDSGDLDTPLRRIHLVDANGGPPGPALTRGFEPSWRPEPDPLASPSPELTASAVPSATVDRPTPVSSTTPIAEPTLPALPTLIPFPTFPPPEPTEPGPAPSFPPPSPTATASPTPTAPGPPPVYLPILRLDAPPTEVPTEAPTPTATDAAPGATPSPEPTPAAAMPSAAAPAGRPLAGAVEARRHAASARA